MKNNEIKNEIDDIKNWEEKIKRKNLIYRANKYKYGFQQYETIRSLKDESIYTGKIAIDEAEKDQNNLLGKMVEFNDKSRPKNKDGKGKKEILFIV